MSESDNGKTEQEQGGKEQEQQTGAEQEQGGEEQEQGGEEQTPSAEDFAKLKKKAERRDQALREAQKKIRELEGKGEEKPEDDPVVKANQRLVRSSAKAALAEAGVKREDHAAVLAVLNLSDVEVDEDGEVDEDEIADRIERLRKVFGATQGSERPRGRTPRVDTRDRGGAGGEPDPDAARFRKFLTGR